MPNKMVEPSQIGIRLCPSCQWLFVSKDVARIHRCDSCKSNEDPHITRIGQPSWSRADRQVAREAKGF